MSRELLKSTSVVGLMTLLSRVSGLVRDVVFAQFLGAGLLADVFFVAFRVPNFLRRVFGEGAFTAAFVPVFTEVRAARDARAQRRFLDLMAGRLGALLLLVTALGVIFAHPIVSLLAVGWTDDAGKLSLAADTLRLTFPYLFFISLVAMSAGILNTVGRFAAAAVTPVLLNLCLIAALLFLAPVTGNAALALGLGVLLAGGAQLAFQLPFLKREGLLPRPRVLAPDAPRRASATAVSRVFRLMVPALFGSSIHQLNVLVNTVIASFLVTGSISWLYYSDRLMEFPLGVFGIALATAVLPGLSRHHAAGDAAAFDRTLNAALKWVWLIGLPAAVALAVLAVPLIATLFHYRDFGEHDVFMSARALAAYAAGLVGFVFVKVLSPGFFARQDTATPVRVGVVAVAVNVALSLALFRPLGHVGLAAATSAAACVNAVLLARILIRARVLRIAPGHWPLAARAAAASVAMAAALYFVAGGDGAWISASATRRVGELSLCVGSGFLVYVLTLFILGFRPRHVPLRDE